MRARLSDKCLGRRVHFKGRVHGALSPLSHAAAWDSRAPNWCLFSYAMEAHSLQDKRGIRGKTGRRLCNSWGSCLPLKCVSSNVMRHSKTGVIQLAITVLWPSREFKKKRGGGTTQSHSAFTWILFVKWLVCRQLHTKEDFFFKLA